MHLLLVGLFDISNWLPMYFRVECIYEYVVADFDLLRLYLYEIRFSKTQNMHGFNAH